MGLKALVLHPCPVLPAIVRMNRNSSMRPVLLHSFHQVTIPSFPEIGWLAVNGMDRRSFCASVRNAAFCRDSHQFYCSPCVHAFPRIHVCWRATFRLGERLSMGFQRGGQCLPAPPCRVCRHILSPASLPYPPGNNERLLLFCVAYCLPFLLSKAATFRREMWLQSAGNNARPSILPCGRLHS